MSSLSVKPWSNLERLTLFQFYKEDSKDNWHVRAAEELNATRKERIEDRPKGFFTPANCKAEFDKVMSEPCPSDVPTGADYSRAAVVEAWLAHFWEEDRKDVKQYEELQNVKIRGWMDRIVSLQANRDKLTDEQYEKLYEDVVREDEEVDFDEEEREFRELYAKVCIKHLKNADRKEDEESTSRSVFLTSRLPPTRPPDQSPLGPKTAFRSPSPGSSPLKSPSQFTEDREESQLDMKMEEDIVETMEVDESVKFGDGEDASFRGTFSSHSDQHTKRPRGRPPKKSVNDSSTPVRDNSPSPTSVEGSKSPVSSETRRSSVRNEASASSNTAEKDSIHVVDSPAGRVRGARRPIVVDSPLVKSSGSGRTSAGADVKKEDSKEELRSQVQGGDTTSRPVTLPTTTIVVDEYGGTGVQTALSIRMSSWNSSESDTSMSRKSSRSDRRSTPVTSVPSTSSSSHCDIAVQTDRVKFDVDDAFVVGYPLGDVAFAPPTSQLHSRELKEGEVTRSAHCSNDQSSRIVSWDIALDGSFQKKDAVRKAEAALYLEELAQIWHVVVRNFNDPQAIKHLTLNFNVGDMSNVPLVASPPKRMRKEEKSSGSAPTPKGRMLSMWNILHEHKHSAIFLHPVTDRDAPGYSRAVFCPVDLTTLKRETESGAISKVKVFLSRVFLMFANAAMFNSTGHDVNYYAKEMCDSTIAECMFIMDARFDSCRAHQRRSRQDDSKRRSNVTCAGTSSRTPQRRRQQ
ncbi:hypothetical protein RB195_017927 [Necator americanus]